MPFKKTKIILGLIVFYTLFGFLLLPYLLHSQLPPLIHKTTQGKLLIEDIDFNPFFMELEFEGLQFNNPEDEPLFSLQRGAVNLDLSALLLGKLRFYAIELDKPELSIVRRGERFNFSWLTELNSSAVPNEEASADQEGTLPPITLLRLAISDGKLTYRDMNHESPFEIALHPFSFQARQIDLQKSGAGKQQLRFHTEISDGGTIDIQSRLLSAAPLALQGSIDIQGLKPYSGWRYSQQMLNLEVADGELMLHADYRFNSAELEAARIEHLRFALERLRIKPKEANQDILRIKRLALNEGTIEPLQSRVALDTITLDTLELFASRDKEGVLDFASYITLEDAKKTAPSRTADEPAAKEQQPWHVTLKRFENSDSRVLFTDNTLTPAATMRVDKINLRIDNISSEANTTARYTSSMRINNTGSFRTEGNITHTPLHHTDTFTLSNFELKDANPYLARNLNIALQSGILDISGNSEYAPSPTRSDLQLNASSSIRDFSLNESLGDTELTGWQRLSLQPIRFEYAPNRLHIGEARLEGFRADARIGKEGELNFASLQKKTLDETPKATPVAPTAEKAGEETTFPITLGRFTIAKSRADFTDLSTPLPYKTRLHDINGYVSDIALPPKGASRLDIKTTIDNYATAHLKGRLITADPARDTDLSIALRNLSMQSFTPYSGKFVGRAIDEGKLALDLKYRIVESQMRGDNLLVIKKIALGRDIESKEAMSLPLGLAIALLEDKDGIIDIDMPVKGDLKNPDFKYGKVVIKAIGDLIVKVASAPFRFLGSLLGIEGEQLEKIAFEPAGTLLPPPEREKLDKLAEALQKRPKLRLAIAGSYHRQADTSRLKTYRLYADAADAAGDGAFTPDGNVTLSAMEQLYMAAQGESALESFKAELQKQYEDPATFSREYPAHLMQSVLAGYRVTIEELSSLARQRALTIRDYLVTEGQITSERVTLAAEESSKERGESSVPSRLHLEF